MLVEKTLQEFLAAAASKEPTPGGGSVAALVGACGASLHLMIGQYCASVPEGPSEDVLAEQRQELAGLERCVDGDAEAYGKVVAARSLPRGTDAEKRTRKETMQAALKEAAQAPLETLRRCARSLELLDRWARDVKPDFRSDMEAAVHCLRAGAASAHANVGINLAYIRDDAFNRETASGAEDLRSRVEAIAASLLAAAGGA